MKPRFPENSVLRLVFDYHVIDPSLYITNTSQTLDDPLPVKLGPSVKLHVNKELEITALCPKTSKALYSELWLYSYKNGKVEWKPHNHNARTAVAALAYGGYGGIDRSLAPGWFNAVSEFLDPDKLAITLHDQFHKSDVPKDPPKPKIPKRKDAEWDF